MQTRKRPCLIAVLLAACPALASAQTLFLDEFGSAPCSQLPNWLGKYGASTPYSAIATSDPKESSNCVMTFTSRTSAGDAFSPTITGVPGVPSVLEFDFLGYPTTGLGGTIGISDGFPGGHRWLAGTDVGDGSIERPILVLDGTWHHYAIEFDPFQAGGCCGYGGSGSFHVMIEQFEFESGGVPRNAFFDNVKVSLAATEVTIQIKPGSSGPAPIHLGSAGAIPVAIMSDHGFDATQVDPATVTLAAGNAQRCNPQDVDGDGRVDLVCQIATRQMLLQPGASWAVLEGATYAGLRIRGEDAIRLVP